MPHTVAAELVGNVAQVMVSVGDSVELVSERTPELDQIFGPVLVAQAATENGTPKVQ